MKFFVVIAVLYCCNAAAHQQKAAITTVVLNERNNMIEVMHRFSLHDAEHAVKRLFDKKADIYTSPETQAKFANYAYNRFSIDTKADESVDLAPVGHEIEGQYFWVYQESPIAEIHKTWRIRQSALFEIWSDQINTVNFEVNGETKSFTFSIENPSHTFSIFSNN